MHEITSKSLSVHEFLPQIVCLWLRSTMTNRRFNALELTDNLDLAEVGN